MKYCKNCGKGAVHDDWVKKCVICKGTEFVQDDYQLTQSQLADIESRKPKCPTCASTNIEKISGADKVVGAALFGLFSKTAHSQFKCKNCGYKW